jgi:hypothetical protein
MSGVVIRAESLEGFSFSKGDMRGQFLKSFDADANDGFGDAVWTDNKAEALRFADMSEAFACWKRQSIVRPLRGDGHPNRPLTAFSITLEDADHDPPGYEA